MRKIFNMTNEEFEQRKKARLASITPEEKAEKARRAEADRRFIEITRNYSKKSNPNAELD